MSKKSGLTWGIKDIKIHRFNVSESSDFEDKDLSKVSNSMTFSFQDNGNNEFQVFVHYAVFNNNLDQQEELLHADVAFIFSVKNLEEKLKEEKDLLSIAALSVAFSTLRGIIFARTTGFKINQFILPVINPKTFWEQMKASEKEQIHEEME